MSEPATSASPKELGQSIRDHLTYSIGSKRIMEYNNTTIVNAYNYYILEMEFPDQ